MKFYKCIPVRRHARLAPDLYNGRPYAIFEGVLLQRPVHIHLLFGNNGWYAGCGDQERVVLTDLSTTTWAILTPYSSYIMQIDRAGTTLVCDQSTHYQIIYADGVMVELSPQDLQAWSPAGGQIINVNRQGYLMHVGYDAAGCPIRIFNTNDLHLLAAIKATLFQHECPYEF